MKLFSFYLDFSDFFVRQTYGTIPITIFTTGSFHTNVGKFRILEYKGMYTFMYIDLFQ